MNKRIVLVIVLLIALAFVGLLLALVALDEKQPLEHDQSAIERATESDQLPDTAIPPASTQGEVPPPEPAATIYGRVVTSSDVPVSGAVVTVRTLLTDSRDTDTELDVKQSEPTDADGAFELMVKQPSRTYAVLAQASGYRASSVITLVPAVNTGPVIITMEPRGRIAGTVVDQGGRPVQGVYLWALAGEKSRIRAESATNAAGEFTFEHIDAGTYGLRAYYNPAGAMAPNIAIHLRANTNEPPLTTVRLAQGEERDDVRVVLPWEPGPAIAGHVQDEQGRPVPGARVWATTDPQSLAPAGFAAKPTDASGAFTIPYLQHDDTKQTETETRYLVVAECIGYERSYVNDVVRGDQAVEIALREAHRGRIEGIVIDETEGKPVAGAQVYLGGVRTDWHDYEYGERAGEITRRTDQNGTFEIPNVPAGTASLRVYHRNYGVKTVEGIRVNSAATTKVTVSLKGVGTLRVSFRYRTAVKDNTALLTVQCWPVGENNNTQPVTSDMLQSLEGNPRTGSPELTGAQDFEIPLQPGEYHVVASAAGLVVKQDPETGLMCDETERHYERALVKSGTTTAKTITVGGGASLKGFLSMPEDTEVKPLAVYLLWDNNSEALTELMVPFFIGGGRNAGAYYTWLAGDNLVTRIVDGHFFAAGLPTGTYQLVAIGETASGVREILASQEVRLNAQETTNIFLP